MTKYSWVFVLLAACGVGEVDESDEFWDDTTEDDGTSDETSLAAAGKRVAVDGGPTANAERVKLLPVGRSENGADRRVVLQLSPGAVPNLARGDRLFTPAEVQVTTRCDVGQNAAGCDYNPKVRAQLILTGNANDTKAGGEGSKVIATKTVSCTKAEHHCMIVFTPSDASLRLDGKLPPCVENNRCYVNLVLWAWHGDARSGGQDKVIVGGNEGNFLDNGKVDQDKARLMIVRERGITAKNRVSRETTGGGGIRVNTNANPVLIYSHKLKPGDQGLVAGEQFLIEAKLVTAVGSRARFSTEMFLSKNPKATDGNGLDKASPTSINEHNGINCTDGTSPCTTRKVAVFRVTDDIAGPVYVNVVAKSAVPGGGSTKVVVKRNDGWVRSVRYKAAFGR